MIGLKVGDKVWVKSMDGKQKLEGIIYSINEYRDPNMMYAISVEGFDDFIFAGENRLEKYERGLKK